MKFFFSLKNTLSLLTILTLVVFMSACTKEDENPTAPEVPPTATMVMEIDDAFVSKAATQENFNAAALQVGVWNVVLTVSLAIPVAAFQAITHSQLPTFVDGTWVWDSDFNVGAIGHNARLEATVVGNNVHWKMYISKDNAFTDFLWFTGTSVVGNTSGQWLLNAEPNNPTAFLQIDWEVNNNGTTQIRYTNIIPGHNDKGGFIEYGVTENNPAFDAFYTIYHTDGDFQVDIEWNRATIAGRIKNPNHFLDNAWHCWDSSFQSIDCE